MHTIRDLLSVLVPAASSVPRRNRPLDRATIAAHAESAPARQRTIASGLLCLLAMLAGPAMAADWYASPSGTGTKDCMSAANACAGIQAAIDKAGAYDTVHVAQGDYAFTNNRIRIEKEGLRLIGDNSPFAASYGTGAGQVAPGTIGNKAANASVLKEASAAAASGGASGMIWVRNVRNVRIENIYIEVYASRSKEGIVASGFVNGLQLVNNYIKITGATSAIAIGVNVNGTNDSSVPTSEARRSGQFVTIDGNVIEPTASPTAAPKRAIAMENQIGLIARNQLAATTQDLWIQYANADASSPDNQRLMTIDGNWFFGKLQIYLTNGYNQSGPLRIRNNHFIKYGSTFSPPGLPSISLGNGSEAHSVRVMNANPTDTIIEDNEFKGFAGSYRAVWVQNRSGVTIQDNVFTPDPNQSDFTAILVGNRDVWNGISAPAAFGVTILRNTFNANGATAGNKAKAIEFVDDNDPTGAAPGGTLQIGDGTLANANQFDVGIGWYVALDDRTCSGNNHNVSTGTCNGTSSYAIGEGIAYSSGSNASSQKRPFKWDVTAAGNSFGGVFMGNMNQAQYDAVWAKTFDNHNKVQTAATVGNVVYGWTLPVITTGTITFSPTAFAYDGNPHTISATLQEDATATCAVTPSSVTAVGSTSVAARCTSAGYDVTGTGTVVVSKGAGTAQLAETSFAYAAADIVLLPSMAQEPGASCTANPATVTNAGSYSIHVTCMGTNYDADTHINVTVSKAVSHIVLNPASFTYDNSDHALHAQLADESATTCAGASPASVRTVGTYDVSVPACEGTNYKAPAANLTATVNGSTVVHVVDTNHYYGSVADALADSATTAGMTVEIAPGTYSGGIVLTKGVKLVGSSGYVPSARAPQIMAAGPTNPPTVIIDGGGAGGDGLTIAPGVQNAHIGSIEIRNFGGHCVAANGGNHGLVVEQSVIHGCGQRGISVSGGGGIDNVTIDSNEVYSFGDRGIVVWDGLKRDITITNNHVHNESGAGCCGIELQDGAATGVLVADNLVENTGDSGMGFIQLTSGSPSDRPNEITNNTINNAARFGIELKIPNGTGAPDHDGAILVHGNVIHGGGAKNLRDRAGIAVIRRSFGVYPYQVDVTQGVIVRNNAVDGFRTTSSDFEGYGIAVEGTGMSVSDNTVSGNDVGVQVQQGNPNRVATSYNASVLEADQNAHNAWFGRGDAATTCVDLGSNTYDAGVANALNQRFQSLPSGAPMTGGDVENMRTHQRYCSISTAVAEAQDNDTISVAAGVHVENVVVTRSKVKIVGAKAGVDAGASGSRDGSGAGETILVPATAESGLNLSSYDKSVVKINASDVTLDGLVIDTDNTAIDSGVALNGAGPDVSGGVYANGNRITLTNLVVRNAIYAGIDGGYDNGQPAQDGSVISNSRLINCDGASYGVGIVLEQNFYAQVTGNRMDAVRTGIQLDNNYQAAPTSGYQPLLSGNAIQAKRIGIWANLFYQAASTYRIENNKITAASGSSGQWSGIWVESMQGAQTIELVSNKVNGGGADAGRTRVGYLLNNIVSSAASSTAIDGGDVVNVDIGVLATDATRYTGAVNDFIVRNVTFNGIARGALYVEDTTLTPGSAKLTIGGGNTFINAAHRLVLSGAAPLASGDVNEVFVRSARDFVFGAAVSSTGNPACASNGSAPFCAVANASINAGIAAVSSGGTVNVEDGSFAENVDVNKSVTLQGPYAGTPGDAASRGVGEATIVPTSGVALKVGASGVKVRGLDFGPVTASRVLEIVNPAATLTGVEFTNNRVVGFTSNTSAGGAIFVSGTATVPATSGMVIGGNLFQDLSNGPTSGNYAMGIKVSRNATMAIADNVFRRVQSNAMQLTYAYGADVHGNTIDGGAANYTNVGIQVTYGNGVAITDNTFSGTLQGFLFNANSGPGVSFTCNKVTNGSMGVRGASFGTTGPTVSPVVLHNDLETTTALRNDDLSGGIVIGSNYYGGTAATTSGAVSAADALAASPIGNAACGDNAPTQIVAFAGSGQSAAVDAQFTDPLKARIVDALGGAVAGQSVAFSAPASGASATLNPISGSSNYNGVVETTATANGTAGSYSVTAASGALTPASFALTNSQGAATVTVTGATVVYDGNAHGVTVATTPSGLEGDVQVVYTQGATTVATCAATATACGPANAGVYTATATIVGNPNYAGSGSGTLTIARAQTTVAFSPTSFVYDGSTHAVAATLAAENLVNCPVSGTVGPNVGSYTVTTGVCTGTNHYADAASANITVTQRPVAIALSHLVQPADGSPKSVVVTTTPAGVPVTVTYGGSPTPPTAVGSYAVVATVSDTVNNSGSTSATLQIVNGNGDIALVLNGPVDPIHVGDTAQYAATMLANPALHVGEHYGYRVVLTKSGGTPLALSDLATMEVFYQGGWVDATQYFGSIPFTLDPVAHTLTYNFPDGLGYPAGFPIEDASWTWNFRFSFASEGTYTTTSTLVQGIGGPDVSPAVVASIATVVEAALPPTDIHLVLGGPAESVQVGAAAEYTGTMLADPSLHTGEDFFVKVRIGKSGGHALVPADLASMEIYLGGGWQPLPAGSFTQPDGPGTDLVYLFPQPAGAFQIEDPLWTWNFRITYADQGTYTATAQVIPGYQAPLANPDVLASAAISTNVVPAVVVPPTAQLVLLGPVDDVQAHTPAGYTGTLVADHTQFTGSYWMRVRLSKTGGTMTPADLEKMELFNGSWIDATGAIQAVMQQDGNDVVYYFPEGGGGAFPISSDVWSWHFRFTYAGAGEYHAVADLIDAAETDRLTAPSLAHATLTTNVVPQAADIRLQLQGPVVGTVGQPAQYVGTLTADPLPDASELFFVQVRLHKSTGAMSVSDLSKMEILQGSVWYDATTELQSEFVSDSGDLVYLFPKPQMDDGFPIDEASWSWQFRFTYADAAVYTATAQVLRAADMSVASDPVAIHTDVGPAPAQIALQLNGPVADVQVNEPAAYIGRLRNLGADMPENGYVKVRVEWDGGALSTNDLTTEIWTGGGWVTGTLSEVAGGLEIDFPDASGFPIEAGFDWTHQFRITYHKTGVFHATATVLGAVTSTNYATSEMFTEVVPHAIQTAGIVFDTASLHAVYDGNTHEASATTVPANLALTYTYNGVATLPVAAGSYVVVATIDDPLHAGSASAILTIDKAPGTVAFAPLSGPYGSAHAVTATLDQDASASCPVTGVPAANAAPGNYTVAATCASSNYAASGTATYVVTSSTAAISAVGSAPVGVVTVDPQPDADAKKTLFAWKTSGSAGEFVRAQFVISSSGASAQAGDLALEYFETASGTWQPLPLAFVGGQWTGAFGPASGFPLVDGATSQFRATFHKGGRYTTTASLVGAGSGLVLATSAPLATDVAEIGLTGIANAAGRVGDAVETALTLANTGSAALSSGLPAGNPVPAQPAPNDENVRGRFVIAWNGGALAPADTSGPGGNCGAASCASPDIGIEYYDAATGTYRPIYNLRQSTDGQSLYGYFGALGNGGVPVPAAFSGSNLFHTTFKRNTGTYTVSWQVVGISTGTVYAQAPAQTIGIDTGAGASIAIVGGDGGTATAGGNAYDQGDLVVEVRDVGNNPVAGATVAFNVQPGNGGASATFAAPAVTGNDGRTAIHALSNDLAGMFAVNASLSNGATLAQPFALANVADADPAQVHIALVSGDGQTAQVGTDYALPLVAKVTDRFGNVLSGRDVAFSVNGVGATLVNNGGTTDANGLVDTGTVTASGMAGVVAVDATVDTAQCDSGSSAAVCAVEFDLTNTAGGASSVALTSSVNSAEVATAGAYPLTAQVRDANGNAVAGVSVTLIGPSAGAGTAPALYAATTDLFGQVAHTFDANNVAGTFQVQAVVSGAGPASVALENLPGAAAKIVRVSGDGQSTPVGSAFGENLVVRVLDAYDNPVADDAAAVVSFVAPASGATATVPATVTSGAGGVVSATAIANGTAGGYSVVASFNGHDVAFALTNTIGAVTIDDIVWAANHGTSVAYDGGAKAATATVTGSSLAPTFTYNGSTTAPTAAGSYQVIATIDDGNVHGTASAQLTIAPAATGQSGITLSGGTFTYDGSAKPATVTNPNGVAYALVYDTAGGLAPIDAGSYTATLTVNDPNHAAETLTAPITIAKATGTVVFSATNATFDGTGHSIGALIAQEPANGTACTLTPTGEYPRINAGSTTLDATCTGTNYTANGSTTLVVSPKPVTIALSGPGSFPYTGAAHAASATVAGTVGGYPAGAVVAYTPGGANAPVAVGTYEVVATLDAASTNYTAPAANGTIIIGAATASVTLGNLAQVYDGTPREATATTTPTDLAVSLTYDGSTTAPVDAGTYTVVATITEPGYSGSASGTLVVAKAPAAVTLTAADLSQVYGATHAVGVTTDPAGLSYAITYDGSLTVPTAVGSYSVVATITDANHVGSASGTLVVGNGAAQTIAANGATTFSGTAGQPLTGALPSVKVTDAGGHAVAGVAITFAAATGNGTLSGATQTTDQNGVATLGGWTLDATPGTDTVTASAAGVTGTVTFTADGAAASGALSVTITDGRSATQVGRALTYTITVGNSGSSNIAGVHIVDTLPAELDDATAHWQCIAVNGAACTTSGSGGIDQMVDLPAGSSVVVLLTATVIGEDAGGLVSNGVDVTNGSDTITRTDDTAIVLFRDGFELGGDGSEPWPAGAGLVALGSLDAAHAVSVDVDAVQLGSLQRVTLAQAGDGAFRIEAIRIDASVYVRLVARTAQGEAATDWSMLDGGHVALVLDGTRLGLVGAKADLGVTLAHGGAFAVGGVSRR